MSNTLGQTLVVEHCQFYRQKVNSQSHLVLNSTFRMDYSSSFFFSRISLLHKRVHLIDRGVF